MTELVCVVRAVNPRSVPTRALLDIGPTSMWWRNEAGMLGWGDVASTTTSGTERFAHARQWWDSLARRARVTGDVMPGVQAPVSFASFAFDARSEAESVVTVPEIVIIARPEGQWLVWQYPVEEANDFEVRKASKIETEAMMDKAREYWDPVGTAYTLGTDEVGESPWPNRPVTSTPLHSVPTTAMSEHQYAETVSEALQSIQRKTAEKIVVARDEVVYFPQGIDVPRAIMSLTGDYQHCWTYLVNGLLGTTPELLIARREGHAHARVLAGTADRNEVDHSHQTRKDAEEPFVAEKLVNNTKQRQEHQFAVDSLTERLAPFTQQLHAEDDPFVLRLPNVWHLATDVSATLHTEDDGAAVPVVSLAEAVHPTAAVCGTPRDAAADEIFRLETETRGMDRGRYAGPVGWMDAHGDGEFGIALRGGQIESAQAIRLFAGCGVVAGSDPDEELAETHAKMRPMLSALHELGQ